MLGKLENLVSEASKKASKAFRVERKRDPRLQKHHRERAEGALTALIKIKAQLVGENKELSQVNRELLLTYGKDGLQAAVEFVEKGEIKFRRYQPKTLRKILKTVLAKL